MTDQRFEIVFRGDIVSGNSLADVKSRIQQLFKADSAQLERLFSGRPVVLKRGLDSETSERYRNTIHKAGALIEVRPMAAESEQPDDNADSDASQEEGWVIAPVGADILTASERPEPPVQNINTSHLSVAPPGTDVLSAKERPAPVQCEVDTSHLSCQ